VSFFRPPVLCWRVCARDYLLRSKRDAREHYRISDIHRIESPNLHVKIGQGAGRITGYYVMCRKMTFQAFAKPGPSGHAVSMKPGVI